MDLGGFLFTAFNSRITSRIVLTKSLFFNVSSTLASTSLIKSRKTTSSLNSALISSSVRKMNDFYNPTILLII